MAKIFGAVVSKEENQDIEALVQLFKKSKFFYNLDDSIIAKLAAKATPVVYEKGEYIIRELDVQHEYLLVKDGMVKIFTQLTTGRNFTVSLLTSGDSIMAIGIFSQKPVWCSAQALNRVTLLRVGLEDYKAFVQENTQVLLNYVDFCQTMLRQAHLRLGEIAAEKMDRRIVNVLNILMNKFGNTINLTSGEIADLAGTTTETTIRTVCRMKKEGIVSTGRGRLTILDAERLNVFAAEQTPHTEPSPDIV
jgi:CRP/FNR family transcriptional regulator, nitrogen oxide reductase regulator